jgi:phosphoribosylformylglycinamidine (FGAM) synthase PurS component
MSSFFAVKVMPREVILDTQGRAIKEVLSQNNKAINQCRVGRYVEVELQETGAQALEKINWIAQKMLHNPLIETFSIEEIKKG